MAKKLLFFLFILTSCFKGFSQDDPCTALPLPLSPVGSCSYIVGDNTGATDSDLTNPNIDAPTGCEPVSANYSGADVWFYIDLGPTTTSLQIDLTHISTSDFNDGVVALYTGTCSGTLTIIECDDDSGSGSLEANFSVLNALTPNTRVYIRVWEWGASDEGTFNICASEVEDPCNNINNIPSCGTTPINTTIASGFGAFNDSSCEDVPGDEAIYSFTPTVTGNYTITQISTFGHINYLYQTSCSATGWTCIDDLFSNNETSGSFNMTAGSTYYIMLDSEDSNGGNVSFTLNCPIPTPECGDSFYDSGGPSGDYNDNEFETTVITPTNVGDVVTVTFTSFDLESGWDFLYVYNGPDATYPSLGTFSGNTIPGPFTSSDTSGALTFIFDSDTSNVGTGWEANVTCAPYVPPTICGSTFTDSGGTGSGYSNNENTTTTLTPDVPGTSIVATFTAFETEDTYDFLYIYDGPNNTFPLIGSYTGTNSPGVVTSTHPSGALTFVFTSDTSITDPGWVANITCVSNCNLVITDTIYPLGADDCTLDYTELTTNATLPPPTNTIFSETFDASGFPTGWSTTNGAASANWIISSTTNAGGTANEAMLDWTTGSHDSTWRLNSPLIDITGQTSLHLGFRQDLYIFSIPTDIAIYVETSIDNTNWTTQYSNVNPSADVTTTENIDISALDGNTNLYIRFRLTGNTFHLFHWAIDNITITADGGSSVPQVTWSPAIGLYTDSSLTTPYVLGNYAGTVYAAPNGVQIYTAEYPVGCTDNVTVTHNKKTWNGLVDNNWYVANNWSPAGVPTINNCIEIPDNGTVPNTPTADKFLSPPPLPPLPAEVRNLTVATNGYFEVDTNTELIVQEWVDVQGTGILHLKSSSSLIQIEDSAINTGNIHMERSPNFDESTVLDTEYVYWSSPVDNFQLTDISPSSSLMYDWAPTVGGNGAGNHGEWIGASGAMTDGKGYIVRGFGGTPTVIPSTTYTVPNNTALFSGVPNNGIITKQIFHGNYNSGPYAGNGNTANNNDDNWNLIGNPYPSAISANAFTNLNTNINGTIYLWPHDSATAAINADPFYEDYVYNYDGNDYIEHNNTGSNPPGTNDLFIGAGQAFFVLMNHSATSGSDVIFNNSMRQAVSSYNNNTFYRNASEGQTTEIIEKNRIWLDLLSPNNTTNTILVGYVENATNDFDRLFDGYDFGGEDFSFYSLLNNEELSIQGRALPFVEEDIVPLGITATQAGSHTIAINTFEGIFTDEEQDIYIEDKELNITHNIRNSPYTFSLDAGTHNDRFVLRYTNTTLGIDDFETLNGITVFEENDQIVVKSNRENIQSIEVYDILGRNLFTNKTINSELFEINSIKPSEITLFLKVKLVNGGQKIVKIIF